MQHLVLADAKSDAPGKTSQSTSPILDLGCGPAASDRPVPGLNRVFMCCSSSENAVMMLGNLGCGRTTQRAVLMSGGKDIALPVQL